MAKTFRVHIELGNAAMSTRTDVALALIDLAGGLIMDDEKLGQGAPVRATVRDNNGNVCGSWRFSSSPVLPA